MTQTLRRELIQKIKLVLVDYSDWLGDGVMDEITERLSDSVLELRAFSEKPKVDLSKADPAWSILAGIEITQEQIDQNVLAKEATDAFEKTLAFGTLPWNSDKTWEKFYKFVLKVYSQNPKVWDEYVEWRNDKGKYTAYSNRKIRENPQAFMDTGYPEFDASRMYRDKPQGRKFKRLNQ